MRLKTKKIPLRMCLGCRVMMPKKELTRIVKNQAGEIRLDNTGKMAGRGAYICKKNECLELCIKNKALNKAFEMNVDKQVYETLKEELEKLDAGQ
jgi:predicted RNA-binding protein YlxR (DUF448 family)